MNRSHHFCDEHNGTVASFEKLNQRLDDLSDYADIFKRSTINVTKYSKIAGGTFAGIAVFCPVAYLAAPGIASALGAAGLLGTSGTGVAISSLSGAALTSASLAAIGPGGIGGGIAFITAAGAALGGTQGAVVSNNYFGAIKDFKISKLQDGSGPALIFINGFLSQKNQDATDWIQAVSKCYPDNPYYYITWESSSLYKMGSLIGKGVGSAAFKTIVTRYMKRGCRTFTRKLHPFNWIQTVAGLIGNPWHTSLVKSSMTGILLADLLARTDHPDGFILMGHSLGARVIYYTLKALATKTNSPIIDVFVLGGAVDCNQSEDWMQAIKAVNGRLVNCYSSHDNVLRFLYRGANALSGYPMGLGKINLTSDKIINKDVSSFVNGHMHYKRNFHYILRHF